MTIEGRAPDPAKIHCDLAESKGDVINDRRNDVHRAVLQKKMDCFPELVLLDMAMRCRSWELDLLDMAMLCRIWIDTCTTDGRGVGGVLTQWHGDGEFDLKDSSGKGWRPVARGIVNESARIWGN